jgi:hypothetical protein
MAGAARGATVGTAAPASRGWPSGAAEEEDSRRNLPYL